jgi:hypothetical protein
MSSSNYEKQKDSIIEIIDSYVASGGSVVDIEILAKAVFDIASKNKFYSEIYANLYTELSTRHSVFRDLMVDFVNGFSQNIGALQYIDPDIDYDIDSEDNIEIQTRIDNFKGRITFLESTFTYQWIRIDDELQRNEMMINFIKMRIQ